MQLAAVGEVDGALEGTPDGMWADYDEKGVKRFEGTYKMGKEEGKHIFYDALGEKENEEIWENGQLIS